jgi:hypothetical protein
MAFNPARRNGIFPQNAVSFINTPASGFQSRVDMFGSGFGFIHG